MRGAGNHCKRLGSFEPSLAMKSNGVETVADINSYALFVRPDTGMGLKREWASTNTTRLQNEDDSGTFTIVAGKDNILDFYSFVT